MPPRPLIVPPRCVEDPPLAVRSHPRPRLSFPLLLAVFENDAILLVMLGMHVRLIPTLERPITFEDRMLDFGQLGGKHSRPVPEKLRAHQFDVLRRVEEAVRRAMKGNETLA